MTMKTQTASHTPGPWQAELQEPFTLGGDCREVVALDSDGMVSRGICTFMLDTDEHPNGKEFLEDVANARLIAAAPDLLAALEALTTAQDAMKTSSDYLPGERNRTLQAARATAKAAIAKATAS